MARRWDSGLKKPINPPVVPQQYGVTDEEKAKWNGKQDALKYDEQPIEGSSNIVNSGNMYRTLEKFRKDTEKAYKDYFNGAVDGLGTATNLLNQTSTLLEAVQHEVETDRQEVSFNKELVEQYTEAALSYQNSAAHCAQIAQELAESVAETVSITPEEIDALIAEESAAIKAALPYGVVQVVAADTNPNTLITPGLYRFITTTEGQYGTRTIIKVWQMDARYIVQEMVKMTAGYMLTDATQMPYAARRTYDTTTKTWTEWDNVITQADVIDELTSTYTKTPLSANQGRVLKELIDTLSADNTAIQDVLTNSGLNSHLVEDNLIPTNLTFADLIAKTTVTFFANTTDETNFPRGYGSGVMIPQADTRYRSIYYISGNYAYIGHVTVASNSVVWNNIPNQDAVVQSKSSQTYSTLKAFVESTATGVAMSYGFRFKDDTGWTPYASWWHCWVQYQNSYNQNSYDVGGNVLLMSGINKNNIYYGFIKGKNGSYTVEWKKLFDEGTVLWENANPNSSIDAQISVAHSVDLSKYRYIEILYTTYVGNQRATTGKVELWTNPSDGSKSINMHLQLAYRHTTNGSTFTPHMLDRMVMVNNTNVIIDILNNMNVTVPSSTVSGQYLIPYRVVLYK